MNENFGFISDNDLNIQTIAKRVYEMIHDKSGWKIDVNNTGILKKTEIFDIPYRNMNKVSITIIKFTNVYKYIRKFDCLRGSNSSTAFYYPSESIINDKNGNNMGVVYMSYDYFIDNDIDELEEVISHELRHYFDNIIGVYSLDILYRDSQVERAADFFSIDEDSFIETIKTETNKITLKNYELLKTLVYISDPTELNAFYHSLIKQLYVYKRKYPDGLSELKLIDYILERKDDYHSYVLLGMDFIFDNKLSYKNALNILFNDNVNAMFYYFYKTSRINNLTDKYILKFDKLFLLYYNTNNFSYQELDENDFKKGLYNFLNNHWIPFIYRLTKPKYDRTKKNILRYIKKIVNEQ